MFINNRQVYVRRVFVREVFVLSPRATEIPAFGLALSKTELSRSNPVKLALKRDRFLAMPDRKEEKTDLTHSWWWIYILNNEYILNINLNESLRTVNNE